LALVEDHVVRVYDQELAVRNEFAVRYASSVAFAPSGQTLALGSWEEGAIVELS
jgi:hypothetical protein